MDGLQPRTPQNPPPQHSRRATAGADSSNAVDDSRGNARDLVSHALSHEMQLYFEKVTAAIKSGNDAQLSTAFSSLAHDPGLQELLPYFSQFVSQQVRCVLPRWSVTMGAILCLSRVHQNCDSTNSSDARCRFQVTNNLKNLPLLLSLMKMLRCLLSNPYVHVELYVRARARARVCVCVCLRARARMWTQNPPPIFCAARPFPIQSDTN